MPTPPQNGLKAASQVQLQTWDDYVAEIVGDVEPWRKQMPDGSVLEAPFPTSDQMDAMNAARLREDSIALLTACFGDDSPRLLEMTAKLPFTVRLRLVNDVVQHYVGTDLAGLPES